MTPLPLRIRELRIAKGWNQQELARRSKTNQATISGLESGATQRLDVPLLDRIAKALGVEASALIESKPPRKR